MAMVGAGWMRNRNPTIKRSAFRRYLNGLDVEFSGFEAPGATSRAVKIRRVGLRAASADDTEPGAAKAIAAFNAIRFGGFGSPEPGENRTASSAWSSVESNVGRLRCSAPIRSPISVQPGITLSAPT
jgi:hypothetical protein